MSRLVLGDVGDLGESAVLDPDPDLSLGPGDVLVAMEAAPINPVDFLFAAGWYGVQPDPGQALGSEGVGRVVDAGSGVNGGLVGRRVIVLANQEQGTWADKAVTPARNVVAIGDDGDAAQLAQLSINPVTAQMLLTRFGSLKSGDWVGQTIGNGGVGQYVNRLARRAGLRTLSVVRSEKAAEQVRAAGGDRVVMHGRDLAARVAEALGGRQLDLVLDGEGGETVGEVAQSLRFGGTVVAYSSATSKPPVIGLADLIYRELHVVGWWLVNWLRIAPRAEIEHTYSKLATLVRDGEISSTVEAAYPLAEYREAIAHAATPGRSGKVMFVFDGGTR
jgi:NADPH:quinone reductase-like Zn-dependent oxidoreductase